MEPSEPAHRVDVVDLDEVWDATSLTRCSSTEALVGPGSTARAAAASPAGAKGKVSARREKRRQRRRQRPTDEQDRGTSSHTESTRAHAGSEAEATLKGSNGGAT